MSSLSVACLQVVVITMAVWFELASTMCIPCSINFPKDPSYNKLICPAYRFHLACLNTMTYENGCDLDEVRSARSQIVFTKQTLSRYGCSGARSLMTSLFPVLVLTAIIW